MNLQTVLLTLLLSVTGALHCQAQTCRVCSGVGTNGNRTYIEVYEYDFVEEKPSFPGGDTQLLRFINEHRRYPAEAYDKGIEGRVTCAFVVNADGAVSNISVLRGVESSLNREAVRILSRMPAWTPGRIDGQQVPVRVICAIPFRK